MTNKPWAAKGVALYPPSFAMVGQNPIFNALHQFRRAFWDGTSNDIAGFFVAFGDWGLGKTRLGYELIAEATGGVDQWLLNQNEYVIPPYHQAGTPSRVLNPALQDGVLPLYIRYGSVCDEDLDAQTWVARLAVEALRHTLLADPAAGGPRDLYEDLLAAMQAKGVDIKALSLVHNSTSSFDERLTKAKTVLAKAGIKHLWIIVDEVETPGDLRRGLREDIPTRVDDEYLLMVSEVIKHENWRNQHPDVNFLLLCSLGMRDQIQIGPNLRRASSVTIEPNQLTDVQTYVQHIRSSLADPTLVDYPPGTLEGAFLAANRNFGWLNVIMASVHETHARCLERDDTLPAWGLLKDFAKTDARAKHIFRDTAVLPLLGSVAGVPQEDIERLVYGQLPAPVGAGSPTALTQAMADALLSHEVADRGPVFAELLQVHIDERALANELTRPEYGFKAKEGQTDTYFTSSCEISVVGLLEALRAFSVSVGNAAGSSSDFVLYADLDQWSEQLSALYPREGVELVAETLHRIFTKPEYRVEGARFVGMRFSLWRELNRLLVSASDGVRFFKDGKYEAALEAYVKENSQSQTKRATAVCLGLALLLDEHLDASATAQVPALKGLAHKAFRSNFVSPSLEGLRVNPDGRCTILYGLDVQETIQGLRALVGSEPVHPILVVFPPSGDIAGFETQIASSSLLSRCIITHRFITQEEDFLLNYSGRGKVFNPHEARLSKVANGLLKNYQDEWQGKTRSWLNQLRQSGYLLGPIWSTRRAPHLADFAKGYRYMLAQGCSFDATVESVGGPLSTVEFENCRQAMKKNLDPPAAWKYGDLLGVLATDGSQSARAPQCFFALLQELRTPSSVQKLARGFFFGVPESEMKATHQLEQILEVLIGIGLLRKTGELYKAVDRQLLETRRQSASTWLEGVCKDDIKILKDLFPTQADVLLKNNYPTAKQALNSAEQSIQQLSSNLLTADPGALTEGDLKKAVGQIAEIEQHILQVCPLDIETKPGFDCTTGQIPTFEARYNRLSLWQKVAFLGWMKDTFLKSRNEMLAEIDGLLSESADLAAAEGEPFPIAPVTLPLKALKSELENALLGTSASTQTRMAAIPVGDFTLMIDQYLVASKYEDAWGRMEALKDLIGKEHPGSFFARFKSLHDQWTAAVKDFKQTEAVWQSLAHFISDAPAEVQQSVTSIKLEVQKYRVLVQGGLEKQIQAQIDQVGETALLKELQTEIVPTAKALAALPGQIADRLEETRAQLRELIHQKALQALNRVRKAAGQPAKEEPQPADTYGSTKSRYEAFNGEVLKDGAAFFEKAGKATHFELWVDICTGLNAGTYKEEKHPDHAEAIRELKEMKLIRSRLELR